MWASMSDASAKEKAFETVGFGEAFVVLFGSDEVDSLLSLDDSFRMQPQGHVVCQLNVIAAKTSAHTE